MENLDQLLRVHGYTDKIDTQKLFVALSAIGFRILEPIDMASYNLQSQTTVPENFDDGSFLGKIIDTETTGLSEDDEIFEIGITLFRYTQTKIEFLKTVEMFEEPTVPMSEESTIISGRTIEDVRGKRFDNDLIEKIFSIPGIVIAHNANFDRPKLEKRFDIFRRCAWGCSLAGIPWLREFRQVDVKLRLLVEDRVGKCFHGHHAKDDTIATFEVLCERTPDKSMTFFEYLLNAAKQQTLRIYAVDTPFAKKDILSKRGYYWDFENRLYYRDIATNEYDIEHAWLDDNVYGYATNQREVPTTPVTARTRYSHRITPPNDFLHHTYPWKPKKGQRFADLAKTDKSLLNWALSNITDMPESLRRTCNYWLQHG